MRSPSCYGRLRRPGRMRHHKVSGEPSRFGWKIGSPGSAPTAAGCLAPAPTGVPQAVAGPYVRSTGHLGDPLPKSTRPGAFAAPHAPSRQGRRGPSGRRRGPTTHHFCSSAGDGLRCLSRPPAGWGPTPPLRLFLCLAWQVPTVRCGPRRLARVTGSMEDGNSHTASRQAGSLASRRRTAAVPAVRGSRLPDARIQALS